MAVIVIALLVLAAVFFYPKKAETPSASNVNTQAPVLSLDISFSPSASKEIKSIISRNVSGFISSIEKNPEDPSLWLDISSQYKVAGDYGKALSALEYAAYLSPDNYVIFHNIGDIYHYHLRDYKKAEDNYLKSISLNPGTPSSYRSLYELYKFFYTEKSSGIPGILEKGIASNPKSYDFMILLARHYRDAKDSARAISYYDKAIAGVSSGDKVLAEELGTERRALER